MGGFENAIRHLKELSFALPMDPVPTGTRELWGLPVMVGSGCQHMDGGVDKMQCKYVFWGLTDKCHGWILLSDMFFMISNLMDVQMLHCRD